MIYKNVSAGSARSTCKTVHASAGGIRIDSCILCRLKDVWSQANIITELRDCVAKEVSCADTTPLEDDDAYAKAFTQVHDTPTPRVAIQQKINVDKRYRSYVYFNACTKCYETLPRPNHAFVL